MWSIIAAPILVEADRPHSAADGPKAETRADRLGRLAFSLLSLKYTEPKAAPHDAPARFSCAAASPGRHCDRPWSAGLA